MAGSRPHGWAERLLCLAFRVHPPEFRDVYAEDMLAYYRDVRSQSGRRGPIDGTRFLASSVLAAVKVGLRQRRALRTRPRIDGALLTFSRSGGGMSSVWYDLRLAVRSLVAQRRFAIVAILLLAIGIGATTAVFSVFNSVLLRPLPYVEPSRLVAITSVYTSGASTRNVRVVRLTDMGAWRTQVGSIEAMGAFAYTQLPIQIAGRSYAPVTALMDSEFLPTLGNPLALGTFFSPAEGAGDTSAILSHALWSEAFSADPNVVGRAITVDGEPFRVRGVLAKDFQFPRSDASYFTKPVELLIPAAAYPGFPAGGRQWFGIARLKTATTLEQARSEMQMIAEGVPSAEQASGRWSVDVAPLDDETTRTARQPLMVVLAISIVLLLIACTNLMNLFLSRGIARMPELTIRRALGGTVGRLVRQLLAESLVIAAIGGAFGVLLARLAVNALVALSPVHLPVTAAIDVDGPVLLFTAAICVASTLAAGLLPALHFSLKAGQASATPGFRVSVGRGLTRMQQSLCVAQIALGVALLAAAGLLGHSLWRLQKVDPGFDADRVLGFNLSVPNSLPLPARIAFYERALVEVRTIPGVERAGLISFLPPETRAGVFMGIGIEGAPRLPAGAPGPTVNTLITSSDYFKTMRMPIVRGRDFTDSDAATSRLVVIVNESFVRKHLSDSDGIGRRIGTGFDGLAPVREIVGIVRDSHDRGLASAASPTVYTPVSQFALPYGSIAVRTQIPAEAVIPVIRDRVSRLNAAVALSDFQTIDARVSASLREPRFYTLLAAICAGMAVLFVTFGLYGLVSYSVSRRRPELGVRIAVGADRRAIVRLVLWQALKLAGIGVAIGLALSFAVGRGLSGLLFEVEPNDPATLALAGVMVVAITLAASYGPARRAGRVDPITVLRDN